MTSSHVGILHPWNMSVTTSVQQSLQMSVVRIQTVPRFVRVDDSYRTQDRQSLLKAKYCPRAMPVQRFVNPGQRVQAVSCTEKRTQKTHVALIFDL